MITILIEISGIHPMMMMMMVGVIEVGRTT